MLLSQRKYAEHRKAAGLRGGTLAAVQKAIAAGRIELVDGMVDAEAADASWAENTSAAMQREPAAAPEQSSLPLATGKAAAERELVEVKTERQRLALEREKGEVIRVVDAEAAHGDQVEVAKRILLRMPDALKIRLAASRDPEECRSMVENEVRQALAAIQGGLAA